MFSAEQIAAHLLGDYVLQSPWMATRKTSSSFVAYFHALTYLVYFIPLLPSGPNALCAFTIILVTHFWIDRFRLARFVVWAKNGCTGPVTTTGYPDDTLPYLAVWLLIITDNVMHIVINGLTLRAFA